MVPWVAPLEELHSRDARVVCVCRRRRDGKDPGCGCGGIQFRIKSNGIVRTATTATTTTTTNAASAATAA